MKRNALLLIALSIVLLLAGLFLMAPDQQLRMSLVVESGGVQEQIRMWEGEETNFFFLPAYTDAQRASLRLESETAVEIDGTPVTDGMSLSSFELNREYVLNYDCFGKKRSSKLVFVRSANIATLHIDTQSGNMDHIHSRKGNEESGSLRIFDENGMLQHSGDLKYIRGRGNSTWDLQNKKPYNIRLSAAGDLLGMGSAEKWVLLANAEDPSNMRNRIVYDFARAANLDYSPDCRWVDLYLNGEYAGLYLLCERNEVHPERVDVAAQDSFLVSQELGGRLVEQGHSHVQTLSGQSLRVHHPETGADPEAIRARWQSIENALLSDDGLDADTGKTWQELIDLDSWARKYLIEELFGNIDASAISQFFYLDGGDPSARVYAGPVWDYDYSMGSAAVWQLATPRAFYANRLNVRDGVDTPWFPALWQKLEFRERVLQLYRDEYLPLLNELLDAGLQEYLAQISASAQCNRLRWKLQDDVHAEAASIADFLSRRADFLTSAWLKGEEYVQLRVNRGFADCYAYYELRPGECLGSLPVPQAPDGQTFIGWFYEDGDEPFDPDRPVWEDVRIYAEWNGTSDTLMNRIGKLIPLGFITILFLLVLFAEFRRNKQGR